MAGEDVRKVINYHTDRNELIGSFHQKTKGHLSETGKGIA